MQPDETLNQRVIESMDGYPSQQSNFPEGVITSRPDLHKIEEGPISELRQFFGIVWQSIGITINSTVMV